MQWPMQGLEPLDLESSALTIRQQHLTQIIKGEDLEVGGGGKAGVNQKNWKKKMKNYCEYYGRKKLKVNTLNM